MQGHNTKLLVARKTFEDLVEKLGDRVNPDDYEIIEDLPPREQPKPLPPVRYTNREARRAAERAKRRR